MQQTLRASFKLLLVVVWIGGCYVPAWIALHFRKPHYRDRIVRACSAGILRILGIHLKVSGQLASNRPLLLVTNHISYLDVPILASHASVCFTPKSEIAAWPIIGNICRLVGVIFIDRRQEKIKEIKNILLSTLGKGQVVCLFPESTTGNGLYLQPFKSGLLNLAEMPIDGHTLYIQPAAITYTHIRNLPIDITQWPSIAWYGDMELVPHLWALLKLGPIEAELVFLPPVTAEMGNRKRLAQHCHEAISNVIQDIRQKRHREPAKPKFHPKLLRQRV